MKISKHKPLILADLHNVENPRESAAPSRGLPARNGANGVQQSYVLHQ